MRALIQGINGADGLTINTGTAATERVRIDASGNVGIGTSSPSSKLVVAGVITADNGSTTAVGPGTIKAIANNTVGQRAGFRIDNPAGGSIGGIAGEVVTAGDYPDAVGKVDVFVQNGATTVVPATFTPSGVNVTGAVHSDSSSTGLNVTTINYAGSVFTSSIASAELDDDNLPQILLQRWSNTPAYSPKIIIGRARGTNSVPVVVANNDSLFELWALGYDGTNHRMGGRFDFQVDGTVSTGIVPTKMGVRLCDSGGSLQTRVLVHANGNVHIGGTSDPGVKLGVTGAITATSSSDNRIEVSAIGAGLTSALRISGTNYAWDIKRPETDGSLRFHYVQDALDAITVLRNGNVCIGNTDPQHKLDIADNTIRIRTAKTPSSATDTGNTGQISWDGDYIYVCTATDTWKRAALSTW